MYSAMSQIKAHRTNPPKGELTQKHPLSYKDNRFKAFLQSDVDKALDDQRQANNTQLATSLNQATAPTIDPLIITEALTSTNTPYAYTLTREAIIKLRAAQSWTYDGEAQNPTVKLNMEHVRVLFSQLRTVNNILRPLHPDKNPAKGPADPQPLHYKVAFTFLNEIARAAFETNTGEYQIIITTKYQPEYSGDLRPQQIKDIDSNKPNAEPPFAWPTLCPKTSLPLPAKRIPRPQPATQHNNPLKRTGSPHPWEYCNKCWNFGAHYSDSCNESKQCPSDFKNILHSMKTNHQTARLRLKRHKTATGKNSGGGAAD